MVYTDSRYIILNQRTLTVRSVVRVHVTHEKH